MQSYSNEKKISTTHQMKASFPKKGNKQLASLFYYKAIVHHQLIRRHEFDSI